jgi:hypothetical protein
VFGFFHWEIGSRRMPFAYQDSVDAALRGVTNMTTILRRKLIRSTSLFAVARILGASFTLSSALLSSNASAGCSVTWQAPMTGIYNEFTTVADTCYVIPEGIQASFRSYSIPIIWGRDASIFHLTNSGYVYSYATAVHTYYDYPNNISLFFNGLLKLCSIHRPALLEVLRRSYLRPASTCLIIAD